jgi:hypothetical protein
MRNNNLKSKSNNSVVALKKSNTDIVIKDLEDSFSLEYFNSTNLEKLYKLLGIDNYKRKNDINDLNKLKTHIMSVYYSTLCDEVDNLSTILSYLLSTYNAKSKS